VTNATTVPGGLEARQPVPPPARTPAEIEANIEATRARLAGTVDAIAYRVKPANVARRGVRGLMSQVVSAISSQSSAVLTPSLPITSVVTDPASSPGWISRPGPMLHRAWRPCLAPSRPAV